MYRVISILSVIALLFVFSPTTTEAKCGCKRKYDKCLTKAEHHQEVCNDKFDACIDKCKDCKDCKKECKAVKASAVQDCKDSYKESTECPDTGKAHRQCVKELKKKRNKCIKRAKKINCNKLCKTSCK